MNKRIKIEFTTTQEQYIDINGEHDDEDIIKALQEAFENNGYKKVKVDISTINMPLPKLQG